MDIIPAHNVNVSVQKWTLRLTAALEVYNANPSPLKATMTR